MPLQAGHTYSDNISKQNQTDPNPNPSKWIDFTNLTRCRLDKDIDCKYRNIASLTQHIERVTQQRPLEDTNWGIYPVMINDDVK